MVLKEAIELTPYQNIGPREARKRLVGGWISLVLGVAVVVALAVGAGPRWLRVAAFPLFAFGSLGIVQAASRT